MPSVVFSKYTSIHVAASAPRSRHSYIRPVGSPSIVSRGAEREVRAARRSTLERHAARRHVVAEPAARALAAVDRDPRPQHRSRRQPRRLVQRERHARRLDARRGLASPAAAASASARMRIAFITSHCRCSLIPASSAAPICRRPVQPRCTSCSQLPLDARARPQLKRRAVRLGDRAGRRHAVRQRRNGRDRRGDEEHGDPNQGRDAEPAGQEVPPA